MHAKWAFIRIDCWHNFFFLSHFAQNSSLQFAMHAKWAFFRLDSWHFFFPICCKCPSVIAMHANEDLLDSGHTFSFPFAAIFSLQLLCMQAFWIFCYLLKKDRWWFLHPNSPNLCRQTEREKEVLWFWPPYWWSIIPWLKSVSKLGPWNCSEFQTDQSSVACLLQVLLHVHMKEI